MYKSLWPALQYRFKDMRIVEQPQTIIITAFCRMHMHRQLEQIAHVDFPIFC